MVRHLCGKDVAQWSKNMQQVVTISNATKITTKKAYGKIPLTSLLSNKNPWEMVHIDCCGSWKIRYHNKDTGKISTFKIHLLTMIKACTGWSEFS